MTTTARLVPLDAAGRPMGGVAVGSDRVLVGRDPHCDLVLHDRDVSRRHAQVVRSGRGWTVHDLDSTNGTVLRGVRLSAPADLHDGDVMTFGSTNVRWEDPSPGRPTEGTGPLAGGAPMAGPHLAPPNLVIGTIRGHDVNVVEGVQYIQHVQQVLDQRRSFLRDVAATRTWARWLAWPGLLLFVSGFTAVFTSGLRFLEAVFSAVSSGGRPDPAAVDVFSREVAGVPVLVLGFGSVFVGILLLLLGLVLHVVATARLSRIEQRLPVPRIGAGNY
ncbi:FHA domain-containing protein [Geodermatophilus sp. CPCC 205506]|uniref:FHA domain-containing protein n=1 Tax=Geodermatophilus sp. CPCC 205506 TaxID=2936596 RepID=UPI003EED55A5